MNPNSRNYPKGYVWIMQQLDHKGDDCLIWPFCCCTPGYGAFPKSKGVLRLLLVRCLRGFGLVQTARVLILDRPDLALTDLHVMASRSTGCLSRSGGESALAGAPVNE